jgi:anti-sigma B factor antagonist
MPQFNPDTSTPSDGFAVTLERDTEGVRVRVVGQLDIATVAELDRVLEGLSSDGPGRLLIDLNDVEFMDSTGLATLIRAKHSAESTDRCLTVRHNTPAVRRLLELSGLLDRFPSDDGGC